MLDLTSIRKELSLTQAELAEKLGVHQTTISRFETGELPLDERTALAVLALKAGIQAQRNAA
jgi:transcriptional regulator with XRE-family HTH domain